MFSELGTIVFYRHYDKFQDILARRNVKEQSLGVSDEAFIQFHGFDRQELFRELYNSNELWGFVCGKIGGRAAYKILNSNDKLNHIDTNDIYFALSMDDFSFSFWAEMENEKRVMISDGSLVLKKPSSTTIKSSKFVKTVFGMGNNLLYQIVALEKGSPYYPVSNTINSRWEDYDSYSPKKNEMSNWYKNLKAQNPNFTSPYGHFYPKWNDNKSTLHAIPFIRDNLKPTAFTVKGIDYASDLRMFINFPNGLPIKIV